MRIRRALAYAAVSLAATACQSRPRPTVICGTALYTSLKPAPAAGQIQHVVLVWLKTPGDPAAADALVDASRQLASIPGVLDVRAGPPLPSTRPVVDSSFDVGMVITFTDAKALADYATHPTHVRLVEEVLKPHTDRYKVYDVVTGN